MVAQAQAELPNECCGLLAGRIMREDTSLLETQDVQAQSRLIGQVMKRYPFVNAAASPVEYYSDARSLLEATRDMRQRGLEILAIYHSHPTTHPVPSRRDLERNCYGADVVHLIISLVTEEPEIRGWRLTENAFFEAEWDYGAMPVNIQIVVHYISTQEPVYVKQAWD
jgi:proteasome lid subunit RPN8/RPN11